jgi:hypothetical protein
VDPHVFDQAELLVDGKMGYELTKIDAETGEVLEETILLTGADAETAWRFLEERRAQQVRQIDISYRVDTSEATELCSVDLQANCALTTASVKLGPGSCAVHVLVSLGVSCRCKTLLGPVRRFQF